MHSGEEKEYKLEAVRGEEAQSRNGVESKPRRRFAPEPIETISKQSRGDGKTQKYEATGVNQQDVVQPEVLATKRRRFAPEPVEVTSKSNRNKEVNKIDQTTINISSLNGNSTTSDDSNKPIRRRFAPQPIETVSRTSRSSGNQKSDSSSAPSDDEPMPLLPHEMALGPPNSQAAPKRSFAPEPIETSSKSSRSSKSSSDSSSDDELAPSLPHEMTLGPPSGNQEPPKRRFAPQPVESSTRISRSNPRKDSSSNSSSSSSDDDFSGPLLPHETTLGPPPPPKPTRRRFAPQLLETAKRSRKSGDKTPAVQQTDKTNVASGDTPRSTTGTASPNLRVTISTPDSKEGSPRRTPSRAQEHVKQRPNSRVMSRQHSFKVPSLPDIDSSGSEEESRSNSRSQSHYGDSDTSDELYKDATRMRESVDGRSSGYLLSLAARAADKQLRDQAAAAFLNSDVHEPVSHYVDRSDSDEDLPEPSVMQSGRPDPTRRDSADEKWALKELQRHAEHGSNEERGRKKSVNFKMDRRMSKSKAGGIESKPRKMIGGHQRDPDLKQMRKAASPPMLGSEIEFPRCSSPENARFDVTQGADFLRKQMCYLTQETTEDKTGLWARGDEKSRDPMARVAGKTTIAGSGIWPNSNGGTQSPGKGGRASGLWGGFCTGQDTKVPALPSGLQTPLLTPAITPGREKEDPFLSVMASNSNAPALPAHRSILAATSSGQRTPRVPSSPPQSHTKLDMQQQQFAAAIDARFAMEAQIDTEFSDAFVTQVYNYLSLGYPSLARKFDEELSRISRVPVDELRMDDKVLTARGHVNIPGIDDGDWDEGTGDRERGKGNEVVECRRWRALKKYVKEWARQMGRKEKEAEEKGVGMVDTSRAWGLPVRKGSWGL